ncbi:MAG: hypothetical protein AAGF20_11335 [Pseudomonadota bacterium]
MLQNMIKTAAEATGLTQAKAREAIGIVFNTSERQGSALAEVIFQKMPGARTLSATTGADLGAATGVIARLIEQTPGGRRHIGEAMFSALHTAGLGHSEIAKLLPTIGQYMRVTYGLEEFAHIGDLVVGEAIPGQTKAAAAA